jgi:hypothetical protein
MPSQAVASPTLCSGGGAQALLQIMPTAARLNVNTDLPRLGDIKDQCTFKFYEDGETRTFSDQDVILGGIVAFFTYNEFEFYGVSRAEAIAYLELSTDHVEIATVVGGSAGTFEDMPLVVTKYRDAIGPFGHAVYNHRAFITQLPAGEYLVRWTSSFPGEPDFISTVHLVITHA